MKKIALFKILLFHQFVFACTAEIKINDNKIILGETNFSEIKKYFGQNIPSARSDVDSTKILCYISKGVYISFYSREKTQEGVVFMTRFSVEPIHNNHQCKDISENSGPIFSYDRKRYFIGQTEVPDSKAGKIYSLSPIVKKFEFDDKKSAYCYAGGNFTYVKDVLVDASISVTTNE